MSFDADDALLSCDVDQCLRMLQLRTKYFNAPHVLLHLVASSRMEENGALATNRRLRLIQSVTDFAIENALPVAALSP